MTGVLFSQMTPPRELEEEFNHWYDTEHVPARLALDGFTSAARYRATSGEPPEYVAVYEVESTDVFQREDYLALRKDPSPTTERMLAAVTGFTRFTCAEVSDVGESTPESYLYALGFPVPDDRVAAYDEWYDEEHVPLLMEVPGWQRIRRFIVEDGVGGPWTHMTLHYLESPAVLDSPGRARARNAPLRNALVGESWFGRSERWIYEPVSRGHAADRRG